MATQYGQPRRNGVIGVQMTGAPPPAIPLIAPRRHGPIAFKMMPGPSAPANASSLVTQGPPHRITPLVGPDTAHSSSFGRPSQAQREIGALNARLADAEETISRQESELKNARSQASVLRSAASTQRSTSRLIDQKQVDAIIHQTNNNRARDIDAQFRVIDSRLDQASEELDRAEGDRDALRQWKQNIAKDRNDVLELRRIVAGLEYNMRRRERLAGAETRMQGLLNNMERMLAAAMQDTRASQVRARKAPIAESSTNPVGIARRQVVESQEPGSHGHASDPHPRQLDKGKQRDPGPSHSENLESESDGSLSPNANDSDADDSDYSTICPSDSHSNVMSLDSCRSSRAGSPDSDHSTIYPSDSHSNVMSLMSLDTCRSLPAGSPMDICTVVSHILSQAGSPMDICTEATNLEPAARMLQANESQLRDRIAQVQDAPHATITITPQQVESNDMRKKRRLFYYTLTQSNGVYYDGYMEWEYSPVARDFDNDVMMIYGWQPTVSDIPLGVQVYAPMIPTQVSNVQFPAVPVSTGNDASMIPSQASNAQLLPYPAATVGAYNGALAVPSQASNVQPLDRKRIAGIVVFSERWSNEQPDRKKRVTSEMVLATGSTLLPQSDIYTLNTVPKVPETSVPAVSQPAQSVHVSTEEVPSQVMSEPAVSQPTQTVEEYTESVPTEEAPVQTVTSEPAVSQPTQTVEECTDSVETEQVPAQAFMSAPAVSQPTQTVLEHAETVLTVQVPTEAVVSETAVPQPTPIVLETTEQVPVNEALSEPAVSQPTQAASQEDKALETVQVPTEAVVSEPAVPRPTPTVLEATEQVPMLEPTVSMPSDEVVGVPAPSEPAPTKSDQTEPMSTEEILSVPAVTEPTLNESDLTWQPEDELVVGSLRTAVSSHLDVLLAKRAARTQARPGIMSSPERLQVTATSRLISTSSLVASPEDASVKNAVATGTDSRAGVSKGAKRVEDAESPTRSAQKSAGEQREEMGGEEAATPGLQMPGAWPSDPPAVTASGESDMQEGSALLRGLWTGTRRLSFGVFVMVMVILLSSPLWAGHFTHLVYAMEGPEQFLEELRWEHGYDVPFLERIIYVFLRCFAGDRALFG